MVKYNNKKVTIISNEKRKKARSRSYVDMCTYNNYDEGETRSIVGRYKPVLLTQETNNL